jgi:peroxiredoxin Q/BCP
VSFDKPEKNAAFAAKYDFPFPLLCDTERTIGMAYGACSSPRALFAERITYVIGPDGTIRQIHPKVSVKSHPREILESV